MPAHPTSLSRSVSIFLTIVCLPLASNATENAGNGLSQEKEKDYVSSTTIKAVGGSVQKRLYGDYFEMYTIEDQVGGQVGLVFSYDSRGNQRFPYEGLLQMAHRRQSLKNLVMKKVIMS